MTRKITLTIARIKLGLATELRLGNLDAQRERPVLVSFTPSADLELLPTFGDDLYDGEP